MTGLPVHNLDSRNVFKQSLNRKGINYFMGQWQQKQARLTLVGLAAWSALLIACTWLAGQGDELPGLILGMTASYTYFALLVLRVKRSATLPVTKAIRSMRIGWLIRLTFILLILILSIKIPTFHFVAAVVGLFSLHIVMVFAACLFILKHQFYRKNP